MGSLDVGDGARRRFDVADAVPLLLDARGVVTGWTRDAERLFGYVAAEVVGKDLAGLLTVGDAERVPDVLELCRRSGGWAGLLSARRKDRHAVPVMARITSADEPDGPGRWLVLVNEMSEAHGWSMSRSVLEQMVAGSPIGIAIVDTDLRFVWSNATLAQFGGGAPETRLGLRLADVQPGFDADAVEARMRQVLETGEPVVGYEHVGRLRDAPFRETAHMLSFTRLDDDRRRPIGVYYTVVDITDRHRARQRLALLDRAGRHIGRSLDIARTAQELAEVVVPGFADAVAVDLLESVLRGAEPVVGRAEGPDGSVALRRAGLRSAAGGTGAGGTGAGVDAVVAHPAGSPAVRCLTSGRAWRAGRLGPDAADWSADLPPVGAGTGPPSVLVVPVRARGATLGVTTFLRRSTQEPFDEDDVTLAEDLVSRAAVCVDNARRYTRERDAALVLQRSLLPHRLPEQEAVEVAACYRPADVLTGLGGDWYDLIPLSGARVALVVGEVQGHGIDAAAAMGRLRTAVRTLAALELPPDEVLAHLDDLVSRTADEDAGGAETRDRDRDRDEDGDGNGNGDGEPARVVGAGCLYVVYDPVDGRCAMAAAGHPAPAVVLPDGTITFVDLPQGPPLGAGGPPFESAELLLPEGSTLALHTDGLLSQGEQWTPDAGRERLVRALTARADSLDLRCRTVVDVLVPDRPYDDVALLMARTRRLPPDRVAQWELPADPAAVAEARKAAARLLAEWDLAELSFTTELVVSELVTNAIRYATGPIRLRLIRERTLVCEVHDGGATTPHVRHPRTTDEGGRGLLLVSQVTRRWGTRFVPDGKVIWAEQSLTDPEV
ncbi:SpoIIE family protein phosphatase [Streptomyces phaeoluteigriseus]|uniref:SpoIIE family protein phosphatase n=1 Tax=Streptomyces phaeoluteigriseus TaxID=114686 RepID=UPI0036898627